MRAIPQRMAECWRDEFGRPVPYINIWSGEMPEQRWAIRYDPDVEDLAFFTAHGQGVGVPDFFHQAMQRQRRCMVRRLCQICAKPVPKDAVLVVSSMSIQPVHVEGLGPRTVVSEPWLCPECADFALTTCPGLIRRHRRDDLYLVRPERPPRIIVSRGWIEGPLERQSKRQQPVMWAKLAVHGVQVVEAVPAA